MRRQLNSTGQSLSSSRLQRAASRITGETSHRQALNADPPAGDHRQQDWRKRSGGDRGVEVGAADGHTVLLVSHGMMAINPALYPKLSYDPAKDFIPLTQGVKASHLLLVPANSSARTPKDLVALAKQQPGDSGLPQSASEAVATWRGSVQGQDQHRGDPCSIPRLHGCPARRRGRPDRSHVRRAGKSLELVKAGKLRALAITDDSRMTQLPDVPTMAEAGFPNQVLNSWFGFVVLAGTPPDVTKLGYTANS